MRSTTDHVNEGHDQTAETLNHATEQVAGTIADAANPAGHTRLDAGRRGKTPPNSRGRHLRGGPMDGGGRHRRARRGYAEPV
jgi:hypothetical protein